ncbi:hypothetical protein A3I51_03590 [Candidatus Gottesmanbacteria bacterium RIFCSPLOWO2_02_FULL_38_8]|uniref:Glycosyltransferase 2-like domain-containing protein n=1 Tax=Candidatus Gottesmanbacteria bacterium RIFCSPLOWO2_02_FULL_38_8 TaxID=1798397 RepID=A0A1F6B3A4_9BACT|nr:MAG: hypothetical protein A3I51_03590 [Candidatus Gottesmanbacteria bacterium RIFCSPLOWO2_02_FULL_38_8]
MPKISLAIATYNEQDNIARCLNSVQGLVSEIVAVDGSSGDKTVDILKSFKAKVTVASNPLNFHINKNKAIDRCSGDWILQLDADEVVTPELKREILHIIDQRPTTNDQRPINGFWLPRKNFFLGKFLKKGGQYPDYTLRLYRKGKGRLPAKSVHEQAEVLGKTANLKNPLLHYAYPDFSHYLEHFRLYTSFFAKELKEQNLPINIVTMVDYLLIKPCFWFAKTFIRHKGFYDGLPGFIFSFFSALRFPVAFIKYCLILFTPRVNCSPGG